MSFILVNLLKLDNLSVYAQTVDVCGANGNSIACENSKPGNDVSEWRTGFDSSIAGFATDISVNKGEQVKFKIKTTPANINYHLDIYRLGYYQDKGARKWASNIAGVPQNQPACAEQNTPSLDPSWDTYVYTKLVDCGNWAESASWQVPANAPSGVYIAKLIRNDDPTKSNSIIFIVRDDTGNSEILYQTSDTTWQAYNNYPYGTNGHSLYNSDEAKPAYKVSYNRPTPGDYLLYTMEYPLIKFLEQNGYSVSYFSGVDADRRGDQIKKHKTYVTAGHDEYWSGNQRANVLAARDAGINLASFSGNEDFWKVRFEKAIDGTANRTLVCFKEMGGRKLDPIPGVATGLWRDPAYSSGLDGFKPENLVTGQLSSHAYDASYPMEVAPEDGKMRFWRNTQLVNLTSNYKLPDKTLGYEFGEIADSPFRPAGVIALSTTIATGTPTKPLTSLLEDGASELVHHMSLYKAPSGALVFNASSLQISGALSLNPVYSIVTKTDPNLQQAVINLLADMNISQPLTLASSLKPAIKSTDTTGPTVSIQSPTANLNVSTLDTIILSGTASDSSGKVAAVEVSTDGGTVWRSAQGRDNWKLPYTSCKDGTQTIKVRAADDSGNIGPVSIISISATTFPYATFVKNGDFECGMVDTSNGAVGVQWKYYANSGNGTPQLANANPIPAVKVGNVQKVTTFGPHDGIYQTVSLDTTRNYRLNARVLVESGQVSLMMGKAGSAPDKIVNSQKTGSWETLSLDYTPTQGAINIFVYSGDSGAAVYKVDDVTLTNPSLNYELAPVYSLFNPNGRIFTLSTTEIDFILSHPEWNWQNEGERFKAYPFQVAGTVPVQRFFNLSQGRLYTADVAEYNKLKVDSSWTYEGIAFYAYPTLDATRVPVYRFFAKNGGGRFYSVWDGVIKLFADNPSWGWVQEPTSFYLPK